MRPLYTSFPVVTMPAFFSVKGRREKMGSPPAASFALSMESMGMTRGMILVPSSLSPALTAVSPWREAIIICPRELMAFSLSRRILNKPLHSAVSSIFPSFTRERFILSFKQILQSISAASFSWSMVSSLSHMYRCSFPTLNSTGISSSATMWPLRNTASFVTPLIICVISWQSTEPTASSVFINLICFPPVSSSPE